MPRKAPAEVTPEELKSLTEFLEHHAKRAKAHQFFVKHEDLYPCLAEKDPNRIRQLLFKGLGTKAIQFTFSPEGYYFTLPDSFNLDLVKTKEKTNSFEEKRDSVETITKFKYKYIIPFIFPAVREAVARGYNVLLTGPAGSGKSRMFEEIGARAGVLTMRQNVAQVKHPAELIGQRNVISENGVPVTKFVDGIITECARKGHICILDELDNASAAANEALKHVSEEGASMLIQTERGPELVPKHPLFRLVATANTKGRGDTLGLYTNAKVQNDALLSRFGPQFELDYNPEIEMTVIKNLIPAHILDALYHQDERRADQLGIVHKIRQTIKQENIPAFLNFRSIIRFAECYSFLGWNMAFQTCIMPSFDEAYHEKFCQIIEQRIGKWARPSDDKTFLKTHKAAIVQAKFQFPEILEIV